MAPYVTLLPCLVRTAFTFSISWVASYSSPLSWWSTSLAIIPPPDHDHGLEGEVLLIVVDEPGRTLGDVVQTEGEEDEEDAGDEAEPVPGQGATHDVAADDPKSRHHLGN